MIVRNLNTIVFFALLAAVSAGAYVLFAPFLQAIFIAGIIAILFYPMYERIVQAFHGRTYAAALVSVATVVLVIFVPLTVVSALVVTEAVQVVNDLRSDGRSVLSGISDAFSTLPILSDIPALQDPQSMVQKIATPVLTLATKTYTQVTGGIIGFFVMLFTLFYFFVDGRVFVRVLMSLSPLPDAHERTLFERFSAMSRATIKGTLIIGVIQGTLGAVVLFFAGLSHLLLWWVVMMFFAIIPMLGVGIVGFPVGIMLMVSGAMGPGIGVMIAFTLISVLDNYLRPLLVGRDVQMHTLLVFFATLGGIMSFGLLGFVIGPIVMALFVALWHIYAIEFRDQLSRYNAGE